MTTQRVHISRIFVAVGVAILFFSGLNVGSVYAQDFRSAQDGDNVFNTDGSLNGEAAAPSGGPVDGGSAGNPVDGGSAGNPVDGGTNPSKLRNPLKSDTLTSFFADVLEVIIVLAIPVIVFFIIYAGFLYVTATGDPEKIKKATSAFTWAIVGGVLILGAKVLTDVIENTINAFR